ncbi:DUF6883 domain-containing protein [Larkinella bovis]|uniref:DUF6883 domain-containing protein n=1 Tax=Larkinella bovis TaxID=683041 RepID=A0ABW0IJK4_9BACT
MDNKLPNCEKARIDDSKLYQYLLNPTHPDGKSKARFFEHIGYTLDKGEQLRTDLLRLACTGSVVDESANRAGHKYIVVGSMEAPNGKTYPFRLITNRD